MEDRKSICSSKFLFYYVTISLQCNSTVWLSLYSCLPVEYRFIQQRIDLFNKLSCLKISKHAANFTLQLFEPHYNGGKVAMIVASEASSRKSIFAYYSLGYEDKERLTIKHSISEWQRYGQGMASPYKDPNQKEFYTRILQSVTLINCTGSVASLLKRIGFMKPSGTAEFMQWIMPIWRSPCRVTLTFDIPSFSEGMVYKLFGSESTLPIAFFYALRENKERAVTYKIHFNNLDDPMCSNYKKCKNRREWLTEFERCIAEVINGS